jgi:predicted GTPase
MRLSIFNICRSRNVTNSLPPRIALIGVTGVGKSATINALFSTNLLVSTGVPGTKRDIATEVDMPSEPTDITTEVDMPSEPTEEEIQAPRGKLVVVDMPGLGESIAKDREYLKIYKRVLSTVDVALWILDDDRDLAQVERYLQEIKRMVPVDVFNRIVFCINKVDRLTGPDGHWLDEVNSPDTAMDRYIHAHAQRVSKIFHVSDRRVIPYSASKRYRLLALLRAIVSAVPRKRRSSLFQTVLLQDRVELMDKQYQGEAWRLFAELTQ